MFLATVLAWDAACRAAGRRPASSSRPSASGSPSRRSSRPSTSCPILAPADAARGGAGRRRPARGSPRASAGFSPSERFRSSSCSPSTLRSPAAWIAPTRRQIIREMVGVVGQAPALAERIAAFADVSRPLAHYLGGLASVVRQNAVGGGITYLNGKVSTDGFPEYFFVAFAVKSTLAFLAVDAGDPRRGGPPRAWVSGEACASSWLPVVVLFLASIGTTYNIGIRHLLPVYPFLALFGAALVRPRVEPAPRLGAGPARRGRVAPPAARLGGRGRRASIRTSSPTSTPSPADPRGARGSSRTPTSTGAWTCGGWRAELARRGVRRRTRRSSTSAATTCPTGSACRTSRRSRSCAAALVAISRLPADRRVPSFPRIMARGDGRGAASACSERSPARGRRAASDTRSISSSCPRK